MLKSLAVSYIYHTTHVCHSEVFTEEKEKHSQKSYVSIMPQQKTK